MKKIVIFYVLSCLLVIAAFCSYKMKPADTASSPQQESEVPGTVVQTPAFSYRNRQPVTHRARQLKMAQMAIAMQHMKEMTKESIVADAPSFEEKTAADDAGPEQTKWRDTWVSEIHDDEWSQQMEREIRTMATSLPNSEFDIRHLSCRETVCRMFLQIKGKRNATAFSKASQNHPEFQFGFQLLNPVSENENAEEDKIYNYELIVKRNAAASSNPLPDRPIHPA